MTVALNYREYGAGPSLVLLHGLFGSSRNWHSLAQRFGEHHQVLAVDLRNHGNSPWADTMDYLAMADDVVQLLHSKGLASACVLGHSMGGKAAMALALQHPQLVDRLIIADIAPKAYNNAFAPYIQAMQGMALGPITRRHDADKLLRAHIAEDGIRAFLLQNLVQKEGIWKWRINLQTIADNMPLLSGFPDTLKSLSFDKISLFVYGEASNYVREGDYADIRKLFPQALFSSIPQAGHWLHAEQPEVFYRAVLNFLHVRR